MSKEALLYKKEDNGTIKCLLCNHFCEINNDAYGVCGVRQNKKGVLYTDVYGSIVALNIDPIEKKPFYHFLPGSKSLSIATVGCNFRCKFCQNWQISQKKEAESLGVSERKISPEEIVNEALKQKCKGISYTYTEPTIFFEYALDTAKIAKEKGLYNSFVTNGYMTREALETIRPYLDAANVDLKFFSEENYRKFCGAKLAPVLETIRTMQEFGIWVEITTLLIPSLNDSKQELQDIASFIASVGCEIPWHISRFHPDYKATDLSSTPAERLEEAYEIGKKAGLRYVYRGNMLREESTYCYGCGKELITRVGFSMTKNVIKSGRCPFCQTVIDGVGASK